MTKRAVAIALVCAGCVTGVAGASVPRWSAPVRLSDSPSRIGLAADPALSTDGHGRGVVAWMESPEDGVAQIDVREYLRDGHPGPITDVSPARTLAGFPNVAMGSDGQAVVAWQAQSELSGIPGQATGPEQSYAAVLAPDGRWSQSQVLSAPGQTVGGVTVAADAREAIALWPARSGNGLSEIDERTYTFADAKWSTVRDLGVGLGLGGSVVGVAVPRVALSASGAAVAVWRGPGSDTSAAGPVQAMVMAAVRSPDGRWAPAVRLGPEFESHDEQIASDPAGAQLAMDARGDAAVTWQGSIGNTVLLDRLSADAGARWRLSSLPTGGQGESDPLMTADADGDGLLTWGSQPSPVGGSHFEFASFRLTGGQPTVQKGPKGLYGPQALAIDARGDAVIGVSIGRAEMNLAVLSRTRPNGAWSRSAAFGTGLAGLLLGYLTPGRPVAVWEGETAMTIAGTVNGAIG